MKKIYFVSHESPEIEGMFDENNALIDWWDCNDGMWRGEYFDGFLGKLGIEVIYERDTPEDEERQRILLDASGYEDYDDEEEDED